MKKHALGTKCVFHFLLQLSSNVPYYNKHVASSLLKKHAEMQVGLKVSDKTVQFKSSIYFCKILK